MEHTTSTNRATTPNCDGSSINACNPQLEILQRINHESLQPEAIKLLKNEVDWAENVQLRYEQDIATLRSELEKVAPEYVATQNQLMLLEVENSRLNTELQQAEQLLTQQTGEVRSLSGEVYTLKKQVATLSCQCSQNDSEIKSLKEHNDCLAALVEENKKTVYDIVNEYKPLPSKIQEQQKELAEKTEEIQQLQQKLRELHAEKEQWRVELLDENSLEQKIETLKHQLCEMSETASQNETRCATLQQQIDESKDYKLAVRDQNVLEADNYYNQKLHLLGGDVFGELESVENLLKNNQAENIKVHKKIGQKSCWAPLANSEMAVLRQGHTKDMISKYQQQDLETQQKQLLASQIKTTKSQEQVLESGKRPLKRPFLETTVSSVNIKKVCTLNLSGKENSVAVNAPSVSSSLTLIK